MKKNIFIKSAIIVCTAILFGSCASPKFSNLIRGKYKYKPLDEKTSNIVSVNVGVLPLPKPSQKKEEKPVYLTDLRDSLPHVYMKLLSEKEKDPKKFIDLLKLPISDPEKEDNPTKLETDFTTFQIRFVFSNTKQYYKHKNFMHPNTRLEFLDTSLKITQGPAFIYSVDKMENEFEEIDFGTAQRTQDVKFNSKLTGTAGAGTNNTYIEGNNSNTDLDRSTTNVKNVYDENGNLLGSIGRNGTINKSKSSTNENTASQNANLGAEASLEYVNGVTINEAVAVKLKRLKTGFSLDPKKLVISQRGRPMGDISDNIYVTATLKLDNNNDQQMNYVQDTDIHNFNKLFNKTLFKPASEIEVNERTISYIKNSSANNIIMNVQYAGAIRAVETKAIRIKSSNNALEYDDKVTFYWFDKKAANTITINKNEFTKKEYEIIAKDNYNVSYTLYIELNEKSSKSVRLLSGENPFAFLNWIQKVLLNPTIKNLQSDNFNLFFVNDKDEIIDVVKKTVDDKDIKRLKSIDIKSIKLNVVN
ncbi:hypothetical protein V1389_06910 [Flavobacterium rakeshii]|uniref:hypothetical protein n=1 Tax=Flavobacterium rakeshii TaxID=1038845 RepID=UPI002E7AD158|nr:hypothetical protein [Flavobacterium rakeshii]MEE1898057.1 hypothetical protein [Flavobacterium rakeshii]